MAKSMEDGIFKGRTGWEYCTGNDPAQEIEKVIIRRNSMDLVIEFERDGLYTATLHRTESDSTYRGQFTFRNGGNIENGTASCRLFESGDDIILFGRWIENSTPFYWWAEIYRE